MNKIKKCLIFLFLIIFVATAAATDVIPDISTTTPSSTTTTTAATVLEDDVIYACGKNSTICDCWGSGHFYCGSYSNPLKSLNIKHDNSSIYKSNTFNEATICVKIDVLKKDKILPGFEKTMEKLDLSFGKIESIEAGAFDKFIKLHTLSFRGCNISSINNRIFTKTVGRTLRTLELDHRGFFKLEKNAFQYLTNLTHLNMESSNVEDFLSNKGIFPASLKELNLGFCKISNLHDNIFSNLINLETLKLTGNPLTTIPKAINPLQNLKSLKLGYTQFVVLGFDGIKALGNLTNLDLSNIETLEFIDSFAFCSFPNLTTLDLSNNRKLKSIHENAFGSFIGHFTTKLQELKIDNCNLTVLPESLLQWEKIKAVSISQNPFACNCSMAWLINDFINPKPKYYKTFRGELPRCHSPSELQGQTFQEISGTVCFETNSIMDNRIVVCDENEHKKYERYNSDFPCICENHSLRCRAFTFEGPTFLSLNLKIKDANYTLKKISFAYYPIYTLKKGQIMRGHESTIEEFDLRSTKTEKIENGTFDDFTSLKSFKISGHSIPVIDENILTENLGKTLTELSLDGGYNSGNISYSAFKNLKKLERLSLSWNSGEKYIPLKKELFSKNLKTLKVLTLRAFVKEFDDDLFENLINLEELYLPYCRLTSIPTSLNSLPNLQILDLSSTNIPIFDTQNLTTIFPKLKTLKMDSIYQMIFIEDCAFCPFPNLEELSLAFSFGLEIIHENAFGYANGTLKMTKLKRFNAPHGKLSTLSENLLPWNTVKEIKINGNPFICNCSMAWLINDFANKCPKYTPNMKDLIYSPLKCSGPTELYGKTFEEISTKNCSTNFTINANFEVSENCTLKLKALKEAAQLKQYQYYSNLNLNSHSNSDFDHVLLITLFVIIGAITVIIGALIFYFYRRRKITSANIQEEIDKLNVDMSMSTL